MKKKDNSPSEIKKQIPDVAEYLSRIGVHSCDCTFNTLRDYILAATKQAREEAGNGERPLRWQDEIIEKTIERRKTLLDLGCGEGDLLVRLAEKCQTIVQGVEMDQEHVIRCIERGIPTYHGDIERSLSNFTDKSFDYAVLEETIQTLKHPIVVLRELLRVSRKAFVSFPNFSHWSVRLAFSIGGRMPKTESLPYSWYDTPNIHNCSINDFLDWTAEDKVKIDRAWVLVNGEVLDYQQEHNLTAEQAMFLIEK